MASRGEYKAAFWSEADSIMSFPADTKRDVQKHEAEARRRIIRMKDKLRMGISNLWRQRFAEIKKENDDLEKALKEEFESAMREVSAVGADIIERLEK